MQKTTPKPKYFTWELSLAVIFYLAFFHSSYSRLLWDSQIIFGQDAAAWYGSFHYFIESVVSGHIPYWNPYAHGGEPFYFVAQHFRLFDPLMLFPVLYAKFFQVDVLKLYNIFLVLKEFVYCLGILFLLRYFFRNRYCFFFLSFSFLCLYRNEAHLLTKTNVLMWLPWFVLCASHFYQTHSLPALYLSAYFLGIMMGAGNVTILYFLAGLFGFGFALCVSDLKKLTLLVKKYNREFAIAALLSLSLTLPLIVIQIEKSDVFPVGDTYGAREHSVGQFQAGISHPPLDYAANFLSPSYFAGNHLKPGLLKYYLGFKMNPADALLIVGMLFILIGIFFGKFYFKRHLALCLILLLYLSIATTPFYRFLFTYCPLFNQLKHPIGFLYLTEIGLLFFTGYGILFVIENKDRMARRSGLALILLTLLFWGPTTLKSTLRKWQKALVDRDQTINQLNPIYNELSQNRFQVSPIHFSSERFFATPRPGALLYEPLLLKKNLALTTIIEPEKGKSYGGTSYMRISQDPVISNRTLYWPKTYVPLYLMGEENVGAFLDLMGVGQPLLRFYTEKQTISYPASLTSQLFLRFDYQYDENLKLKYAMTQDKLFLEHQDSQEADDVGIPPKIAPQIKSFSSNSLSFNVNVSETGYLLYNDSHARHWTAFVDGTPTKIFLANLAFKAVFLKKGLHAVTFTYFPTLFASSLYLSFLVQLFCLLKLKEWLVYVIVSRFKVKRREFRFQ